MNPTDPNNRQTLANGPDDSLLQPTSKPTATSPLASSLSPSSPTVPQVEPWSPLTPPTPVGGGRSRKKMYIILAVVLSLLLAAASAAFVFAYYLPNLPENVYKTSLVNSAKGVDAMTHYLTNDQTGLLTKSGGSIKGSFTAKADDIAADGSFTSSFKANNNISAFNAGVNGTRVTLDVMTTAEKETDTPDIYLKASGLKGLSELMGVGVDTLKTDAIDNRWIFIDHTLLDSLGSDTETKDKPTMPTEEQYKSGVNAAARVTKEYVFTDDETKAIAVMRQFVGKTTENSHDLNHYKVSVNKAHTKAYFTALGAALDASGIGQWYEKSMGEKISQSSSFKNALTQADKIDESRTYDLYIDTKTKVIYKLHVDSVGDEAQGWFEVGIDIADDKVLPFFLKMHTTEKTAEGKQSVVDITLNQTFDSTSGMATLKFDLKATGESAATATANMTYTPSDKEVVITRPSPVMTLPEAMQALGIDDAEAF